MSADWTGSARNKRTNWEEWKGKKERRKKEEIGEERILEENDQSARGYHKNRKKEKEKKEIKEQTNLKHFEVWGEENEAGEYQTTQQRKRTLQ